jgi:hypothetical protein
MSKGQTLFNFGNYTFTSWARRGVSNNILPNGNTLVRAQIPLSITLNTDAPILQQVELFGPADVASLSRRAIVRTTPLNGNFSFEWNLLPYIEFYDEDFLWRFTPDAPDGNNNLKPWLALVVLKEGEFTELPSQKGALNAIRLQTTTLPNAAELHLWAHVHTGDYTGVMNTTNVKLDPDGYTCRLLSPRRLEASTLYRAFVIPAYETGRLAGLGEKFDTISAKQLAWGDTNRPATLDFPVYHTWTFGTTEVSFEELVARLKTAAANPEVGIRPMDTGQPGYTKAKVPQPQFVSTTTPSVLGLEGALKSPATVSTKYPETDGVPDVFQKDVFDLLSLYDATTTTYDVATPNGDPILTIPLYGQPYAAVPAAPLSIDSRTNWYSAINLDPRNRVAAALGTQVVQKSQEDLMASAWEQLQTLQKARNNFAAIGSIVNRVQVLFSNPALVAPEDFFSMTGSMTNRILDANRTATVFQNLNTSQTPNALVNSATRRILRSNGGFSSKLGKTAPVAVGLMAAAAAPILATSPLFRLNTTLNGAESVGTKTLISFRTTRPIVSIFNPPPDDNSAFNMAYRHFQIRVGGVSILAVNIINGFDFRTATQSIAAAIGNAPSRQLKSKINLSAINTGTRAAAAVPMRPPAEFLGQPTFNQPMYEPLWKMDKEWLLPNLNLIDNNTLTLLETNAHFINAYMLGLNQELGREMLWREYPADLTATFFRNFWSTDDGSTAPQYNDIEPVQKWLGQRASDRQTKGKAAKLVLTIRGDLLKKFPNTIIFAASMKRGQGGQGKLQLVPGEAFKFPSFRAELPPDLQFIGFDLSVEEILREPPSGGGGGQQGRAWYFVIMEPVGEPHFGLDSVFRPDNPASLVRNDLAWEHVNNANFITASQKPTLNLTDIDKGTWGKNAAVMAEFLFQQPFAMIVKATDLLPK